MYKCVESCQYGVVSVFEIYSVNNVTALSLAQQQRISLTLILSENSSISASGCCLPSNKEFVFGKHLSSIQQPEPSEK